MQMGSIEIRRLDYVAAINDLKEQDTVSSWARLLETRRCQS